MAEENKIEITIVAEGAEEAAKALEGVNEALEKQVETQGELGKVTEESRKSGDGTEELKRAAEGAKKAAEAFGEYKEAAHKASKALSETGDAGAAFRSKLGPATALIGNLSNSFSVLVPQSAGATKSMQVAGQAASQMLGVIGGGPGQLVIGTLIAGVAALASYFSTAKKEADGLAGAVDKNSEAAKGYLDTLNKLRGEVREKNQKQKEEDTRAQKLRKGTLSDNDYDEDLGAAQAMIKRRADDMREQAESSGLNARQREIAVKRMIAVDPEIVKLKRKVDEIRAGMQLKKADTIDPESGLPYDEKNAKDKKESDLALIKANATGKKSRTFDYGQANEIKVKKPDTQSVAFMMAQLDAIERENKDKQLKRDQDAEIGHRESELHARRDQLERESELKRQFAEADAEGVARIEQDARDRRDAAEQKSFEKMQSNHQMLQDVATQSANIMAGTAIKSFQLMAKGQKQEVGAILEGIGDQIVAMGTGYVFKGIAESILLNAQGPALIGVGSAAVAFGIGLGAAGAHAPGGSTASHTPASANPYSPRDYQSPSPLGKQGPTIVNINFPTVLSPSAIDGARIQSAWRQAQRVYG